MFYLVCTRRPCLCAHCLCCADRAPSRHLARAAIHGLRVPPETHLALEGVCLRRPRPPHRPLRRKEIGTCYGDFGHITCIKDPEIVSVGKAYLFLLSSLSLLSIHHPFTHLFTTLFLAPALVLLVLCDVLIQGSADGVADSPVARRRRVHPQVQGARVPAVRGRGARRASRERRERPRQGACVAAGDQNLQEGVPPPRLLALLFPLPPLGSSLAHCTLTPRTRPSPAPAPSARRPSKTPSSCTTRRTKSGRATRRPSSAAAASA